MNLDILLQVTFANLARKKAAKEQIVLIPEWQNIVNFADSFDPIVRREVPFFLLFYSSFRVTIIHFTLGS